VRGQLAYDAHDLVVSWLRHVAPGVKSGSQ